MSWLAAYETVPGEGADPGAVVAAGLGALRGQMRWHSLAVLHNVTQPVLTTAWLAHAVTSLYNPNALWDLVSGGYLDVERQVVRQLSRLMGWDAGSCDGLFTFGGKAGLLYAIRLGLNRCVPDLSRSGLGGASPMVLTTDQNHYSVDSACSLVGIGTDAVIRVPTNSRGFMDQDAFRAIAEEGIAAGRPLACVVLCGGNTLDAIIDPLQDVVDILDDLAVHERLGYHPWIHFDLPLGWPWLFFRDYDFATNPLGIEEHGLAAAGQIAAALARAELADSTCFDFHKLGFAPYSGSVFLTRHWRELRSIFRDEQTPQPWLEHGGNFRQHHSIEHSRSGAPILAAWVVLQTLGQDGFRAYLGHLHQLTARLRSRIAQADMTVLNGASPSLATMVLPARPGTPVSHVRELPAQAEAQNLYTEALFRYVAGMDGNAARPVAIGFVPGYAKTGSGHSLSALRLFLVNPFLDAGHIDAVVDHLRNLKRDFDQLGTHGDVAGPAPRLIHTPK
jgi:glutamate/tyrosine decarboxylase-like PLP-dependent enzyme